MNRRQFLGRVFQSVISLHNSYSEYGIYHSWRQYEFKPTVVITFRYRYAENKYSSIPYYSTDGLITAIYKDDTMIYCSAYYRNGTLVNDQLARIQVDLDPGEYTIKILSLGKGLALGESGSSMTFTVPKIDRSLDSSGNYNPYNNYGYINQPTFGVNFDFDYEGLTFQVSLDYEDIGSDLKTAKGMSTYTYTYPDYATVKAAVEAEYKKQDPTSTRTITEEEYTRGIVRQGNSATYDYCIPFHNIQNGRAKLTVIHHTNLNETDERGAIYIDAMNEFQCALHKAYTQLGLEYDPADSYNMNININRVVDTRPNSDTNIEYIIGDNITLGCTGMRGNGNPPLEQLVSNIAFDPNIYPAGNVRISCDYQPVSVWKIIKTTTRHQLKINDTTTVVYTPVLRIFYGDVKFYRYMYRTGKTNDPVDSYELITGESITTPNPYYPPKEVYNKYLQAVGPLLPRATAALNEAESHWGATSDDGYDRWFEEYTSKASSYSNYFDIPLMPWINPQYRSYADTPAYEYDMSKCAGFEAVYYNGTVIVNYNTYNHVSTDIRTYKGLYNPVPETSPIDWTGYEESFDLTTGWIDLPDGSCPVILRSTVIEIDLSDIPDHKITPN